MDIMNRWTAKKAHSSRMRRSTLLGGALFLGFASAHRLGKPGPGTSGLGLNSKVFPEDPFSSPAYNIIFDPLDPVRNATLVGLLQDQADGLADGTQSIELLGGADGLHACFSAASPEIDARKRAQSNIDLSSLSATDLELARSRALSKGLSLLAPLRKTCLYHTLDWFTYEFCYGAQVRQFHALPGSSLPGRTPVPDPGQDSYVLGRSPSSSYYANRLDGSAVAQQDDAASSNAQDEAKREEVGELMEVVSLAAAPGPSAARQGATNANDANEKSQHEASSSLKRGERYVSQLWGGGTLCDLNNERRSVEVQFYCSRRPGDRISLVKETTTCN
ncbi:hypothetical protein IE81DRAFT_59860 [Ceraceosorus guamensis]|uniref:Protein OS-9 homolog n=1 Tax=Ceraceosorus guamensis TaxID=1522189 RepID=A0A316W2T9_9BASI|nr:hypothetical protein IE81DRAFT_59860 [Ceraceosorus guamensis]PWN43814.1 hypothetical protein IE81DRAFT_59860 [Ceraceosorus guamensis]